MIAGCAASLLNTQPNTTRTPNPTPVAQQPLTVYAKGVMRTPTRARAWVRATAALLLLGAPALAQNPFEGFPPTAPPPPQVEPDEPDGNGPLPTPTAPRLPQLPQQLPPLSAPVPALEPLTHDIIPIVLTPLDPTAPDALAWIATRAFVLPTAPYLPPADDDVQLLAITVGPITTALVKHEHRHLVVRAGDTLPNGVRIERVDFAALTLSNDAGSVTMQLTPRRSAR